MPLIDVIVSDLGQVLLPFDVERPWSALASACPEASNLRPTFQRLFVEAGMGRGLTHPETFYRQLVETTGIRLPYSALRTLWSDMFWIDEETVDLIVRAPVRERHILSNTNAIHWEFILDRYSDLLGQFDRHWVSHELAVEKPDPKIYQHVIEAVGQPAGQLLFIDDIEENVEAARSVGMQALLHTNAAALRAEFAKLDLIP